jgi:hypothetical protein
LNSSLQIQRNKTISYLPKFSGLEVFAEASCVIIVQDKKRISIPVAMIPAFLESIAKARI